MKVTGFDVFDTILSMTNMWLREVTQTPRLDPHWTRRLLSNYNRWHPAGKPQRLRRFWPDET